VEEVVRNNTDWKNPKTNPTPNPNPNPNGNHILTVTISLTPNYTALRYGYQEFSLSGIFAPLSENSQWEHLFQG